MVTQVTPDNATEFGTKFIVEASSIGIRPGTIPASIPTTLGNGQDFLYASTQKNGPEEIFYRYRQQFGCLSLHVLND